MKITKSKLMSYLKDLDTFEKMSIISGIKGLTGYFEDFEVFENDEEFFNIFFADKPLEVARAIFFGDYNYNDDFVCFNAYGNLKTYDIFEYDNTFISCYLEDVADWLLENVDQWDYLDIDLSDYEEEENE